MNQILRSIIYDARKYIREDNIDMLQCLFDEIEENTKAGNFSVDYVFIFKELFLCACSLSKNDIMIWLMDYYDKLDEVSQIALKHTFTYAKYAYRNNGGNMQWFENNIYKKLKI